MLPDPLPPPPLTVSLVQFTVRIPTALEAPTTWGVALRGSLGKELKGVYCDTLARCGMPPPHDAACPYCALFAPARLAERIPVAGLHLADPPRPYVIRPPLATTAWYKAGAELTFGLMLIGSAKRYLLPILHAWRGGVDLGQGRGSAPLVQVVIQYPPTTASSLLWADGHLVSAALTPPGTAWWQAQRTAAAPIAPPEDGGWQGAILAHTDDTAFVAAAAQLPSTLTVRFLTPMRLKQRGVFLSTPQADALVRNALRRLSTLCLCYGAGPWSLATDPLLREAVIGAATLMRQEAAQVYPVRVERTAGATGRQMPLDGIGGWVRYSEVAPVVRLTLLAGSLVHVGDDTVFGNGWYALVP